MSNKISYQDKVGIIPKTNHVNQWWDDDANEVKSKHNLNDDRITVLENATDLSTGIKSGGIVTWISGLTFNVSACNYIINGTFYSTVESQVTLSAADVTNPRLDIIIVNTSSVVTAITGVPAATPQKPTADPLTQIELTTVLIPAGATEPSGVVQTDIYDENTEWTGTASGVTVDFASTDNPYHGSVSADIGAIETGDYVKFVDSAIDIDGIISFYFAKKNASDLFYIPVRLFLSGSPATNYFIASAYSVNDTDYHLVNIDLSLLTKYSSTFDEIRFEFSVPSGTPTGLYLDYVSIQTGIDQPVTPNDPVDVFWTEDTNGINYQSGNIGIGAESTADDTITIISNPSSNVIDIQTSAAGNCIQAINTGTSGTGIATQGGSSGTGILAQGKYGGNFIGSQSDLFLSINNTPPPASASTGSKGEVRFTSDYIYVCTSLGTWKRAALTTW